MGDGAAVRPGWSADGRTVVNVQYATRDGWKNPSAISAKTTWPSGRWINVEQEVILNEAGKKNGIIRLWLDGELAGREHSSQPFAETTLWPWPASSPIFTTAAF